MSYRVEVSAVDAVLLSALKDLKAKGSMCWDHNLRVDVRLKVEVEFPIGMVVPEEMISAVNACIAGCIAAYKSPAMIFTPPYQNSPEVKS